MSESCKSQNSTANVIVINISIGISFFVVVPFIFIGCTIAAIPSTNKTFTIFAPITFESVNTPLPAIWLVKDIASSGELVPNATTVNAIIPGFVATPWQNEKPEEIKQNIYKKTAIHRFATVDEIVDAFIFCIDNPFVNGSTIEVNGGYCYK